MATCIECKYFSSWRKGMRWLAEQDSWFCEHENREGGRWNVLHRVSVSSGHCARFCRAEEGLIEKRKKFWREIDAQRNTR